MPRWMLECLGGSAPRRVTELMPSGHAERYDFFLSRRGSVAPIAREVTDVLTEKGYKVLVQDYDIPLGASFERQWKQGKITVDDLRMGSKVAIAMVCRLHRPAIGPDGYPISGT
jgi:hypothetical protein